MADARRIRTKLESSQGVASALHLVPEKSAVGRDHAKENVRAMRERERQIREAKEAAEAPAPEAFKLNRFKDVPSRVAQATEDENMSHRGQTHDFLRRGSHGQLKPVTDVKPFVRPAVAAPKPAVPRAVEVADLAPRQEQDFVHRNARDAIAAKPKRVEAPEPEKPSDYGKVPAYLEARKARWAAEAEYAARNAPDPDCPPGMMVMPEEERLETLRVLKDSMVEVNNALARMPLTLQTPSQIRRKTELDAKIREIEDAIGVFSRPKVLVKLDE